MNEVNFIDTTLRDGQMSLWATGMRTDMILPVAATMDQAGFAAIEILASNFEETVPKMSEEDVLQMAKLGWIFDEENKCWAHF